jgi:hypothetical protein
MKIGVIFIQVLCIGCFLVHSTPSGADQTDGGRVNLSSDSGHQAALTRLPDMDLKQAFRELENKGSYVNRRPMNESEAVLAAFGHRKREAIDLACHYLRLPIEENVEGRIFSRAEEFHVAKSVLQAFPDVGLERLWELYDSTKDAVTRGNIVLVIGGMKDDQRSWELLLAALENKDVYDGNDPEAVGYPLRVCDLAYNQITANYEINDVLRTIGNAHAIHVRDDHINRLKKQLDPALFR